MSCSDLIGKFNEDSGLSDNDDSDERQRNPTLDELSEYMQIFVEDIAFDWVRLINGKTGNGFEFEFHGYCVFALWSFPGKNAPFLCMEPWQGFTEPENHNGQFAEKKYIITLPPGGCYDAGYSIKLCIQ